MNASESRTTLVFDGRTIRLLISAIALTFPWVVSIIANEITPSISWSYHTRARNVFVGLLFVIGAFLVSYRGHKPELDPKKVGRFWKWLSKVWKGAINFRIWERKYEEDLVSFAGGIGAFVTALCPTAEEVKSRPADPISTLHFIGAAILFATTVYFCLVAFRTRAKAKREAEGLPKGGTDPKKLRIIFYSICGWGIALIMVVTIIIIRAELGETGQLLFWSEAAALELFGLGWLVAARIVPGLADKEDRQAFLESIAS